MALTKEQYKTLLETRIRDLRDSIIQRSDEEVQRQVRSNTAWIPLPGKYILRTKVMQILQMYYTFFNNPANTPKAFYKEKFNLRKLETQYLKLLYIDAVQNQFDNDLVAGLTLIVVQLNRPKAMYVATEQCAFLLDIALLVDEYHSKDVAGNEHYSNPKYVQIIDTAAYASLKEVISLHKSFTATEGGDRMRENMDEKQSTSEIDTFKLRIRKFESTIEELQSMVAILQSRLTEPNTETVYLPKDTFEIANDNDEVQVDDISLSSVDLMEPSSSISASLPGRNSHSLMSHKNKGKINMDQKESQPLLPANHALKQGSIQNGARR